jgi:hypothetical protein
VPTTAPPLSTPSSRTRRRRDPLGSGRDRPARQQSHIFGISTVLCDRLPELSTATIVNVFVPFWVAYTNVDVSPNAACEPALEPIARRRTPPPHPFRYYDCL